MSLDDITYAHVVVAKKDVKVEENLADVYEEIHADKDQTEEFDPEKASQLTSLIFDLHLRSTAFTFTLAQTHIVCTTPISQNGVI
jgi:hypothetical protein